jgi:1-acyl-sn-glycerol-3-phosphate acyltransferase
MAIFPEGISHDGLQMKPFKAGIANIALTSMEKYGTNVQFIPCAFSLYKQNLFRSKIVLKFGEVITIPDGIIELRKTSKKEGVSELLLYLKGVNKILFRNLTI